MRLCYSVLGQGLQVMVVADAHLRAQQDDVLPCAREMTHEHGRQLLERRKMSTDVGLEADHLVALLLRRLPGRATVRRDRGTRIIRELYSGIQRVDAYFVCWQTRKHLRTGVRTYVPVLSFASDAST